jgi:hypothetical protein
VRVARGGIDRLQRRRLRSAVDGHGTVTCGTVYMLEVGNYDGATTGNIFGTFTVTEVARAARSVRRVLGDTAAACPCSGGGGSLVPNPGAAGNGCANFTYAAGANLSATGNAVDNAGDTLVLTCTNMPGPGLFFQSNGSPVRSSTSTTAACAPRSASSAWVSCSRRRDRRRIRVVDAGTDPHRRCAGVDADADEALPVLVPRHHAGLLQYAGAQHVEWLAIRWAP